MKPEVKEQIKKEVEHFIRHNRKICWEAEMEQGEFCIGESKIEKFVVDLIERLGSK